MTPSRGPQRRPPPADRSEPSPQTDRNATHGISGHRTNFVDPDHTGVDVVKNRCRRRTDYWVAQMFMHYAD